MLALDPNQTCEVKLDLDPVRVFKVRFLTCRETLAYSVARAAAVAPPQAVPPPPLPAHPPRQPP